ncbi:patatin-like phospholipase family protein [Fulvivirga sp. RKSG066]|nr:patatin-like phospholipase family protein [Fulvivirga aurantia]
MSLLLNHFKRNQVLLLCWVLLFAIVSGGFGNYLGVPYLFLDPVYLNKVNFYSFFIIGVVLAGFSIAFHITTYIVDAHRFSFLGTISRPFTVFSLNNSLIPFAFLFCYVIFIIRYQIANEYSSSEKLMVDIAGLLLGYIIMTLILFAYFWFTNKDIFKYVVCKVDEKLKQNIKVTRASAMKKLNIARKKQIAVNNYLNLKFEPKPVTEDQFYDRNTILQVFDQNHFNLVIIEILILALLLIMGIFKDYEIFQLPAAASVILFLTIFVMFAGAFSYWFGNWSGTAALALIIVLNILVKENIFDSTYQAYGLNYEKDPVPYTLGAVSEYSNATYRDIDYKNTLEILNNWRAKFPADQNPKLVFLCTSGGGQRAALWTLNVLQNADSLTGGRLMDQTVLITGASGGLIGASYFRELLLRKKTSNDNSLYGRQHLDRLAGDNLNAIIFSMLMNDLFVGFHEFEYNGLDYKKDRGYAFEQQLNKNTNFILDKPLKAYLKPEKEATIPMLVMAPTIINDGRKLYISPQNVSYLMNSQDSVYMGDKVNAIDFMRFFEAHGSENLRFLSGLRMSATFPYITPNITLPSDPPMEIMDAGITDNFGISDAVRFLYAFRSWTAANTDGVVIVSIRDSEKDGPIEKQTNLSLFERFTLPISSIYQNFESLQDITNDNKIEFARSWFEGEISRIDIQYVPADNNKLNLSTPDSLRMENTKRASLSWRLTSREKQSLIDNINTSKNQNAIKKLAKIIGN